MSTCQYVSQYVSQSIDNIATGCGTFRSYYQSVFSPEICGHIMRFILVNNLVKSCNSFKWLLKSNQPAEAGKGHIAHALLDQTKGHVTGNNDVMHQESQIIKAQYVDYACYTSPTTAQICSRLCAGLP